MKRESLRKAFDDHHERVLHAAFDVLQDHESAEEICVEVFAECYEKMERLAAWRVKGWLLERAKKKAVRALRMSLKKNEQDLIFGYQVERKDTF